MVNAILEKTPIFNWIIKRSRASRVKGQLEQLTDRELMDIGIQRHEINSLVRKMR